MCSEVEVAVRALRVEGEGVGGAQRLLQGDMLESEEDTTGCTCWQVMAGESAETKLNLGIQSP